MNIKYTKPTENVPSGSIVGVPVVNEIGRRVNSSEDSIVSNEKI